MPDLRKSLPPPAVALLERVGAYASAQKVRAWLVGGLVRDLFLGVGNADLDIAVEGDGLKFARGLAAELPAQAVEYERFLTATLTTPDLGRLDIATARAEDYDSVAALPKVRPAPMKADLHRRDFTINAMAASLEPGEFGTLMDPFGGVADVSGGLIRIMHDASFRDDPTRMMRGARFAARFGFVLEAGTARLVGEALAQGVLGRLSADRLRNEFFLAFMEPEPGAAVVAMADMGLLKTAVPGADSGGDYANLAGALARLLPMVEKGTGFDPAVAHLLLLFRGADAASATRAAAVLNLGAVARRAFDRVPALGGLAKRLAGARTAGDVHRVAREEPAEVLLAVLVMLGPEEARKAVLAYLGRGRSLLPATTGDDLIRMGYAPGPLLSVILETLLQEKLDGRLADRAAEEEFILRTFPRGGTAGGKRGAAKA